MKRILFVIAFTLSAASMVQAGTLNIRPLSHSGRDIRATEGSGGFSVDFPIVGHVRGATVYSTSLDLTNHSSDATDVEFFYTPSDGSTPVSGFLVSLAGYDSLHLDDFLGSLVEAGLIPPNEAENSFGSLTLTFTNAGFHRGNEAGAKARIYSSAPGGGTYGLAYRGEPLHRSGAHSLATGVHDSQGMVTNLGIENIGIDDAGALVEAPVVVQLSFFDTSSGSDLGVHPTYTLAPGQTIQINDVVAMFALPASVVVFVDETSGSAQIRGYTVEKDTMTNDGAFALMEESATPF